MGDKANWLDGHSFRLHNSSNLLIEIFSVFLFVSSLWGTKLKTQKTRRNVVCDQSSIWQMQSLIFLIVLSHSLKIDFVLWNFNFKLEIKVLWKILNVIANRQRKTENDNNKWISYSYKLLHNNYVCIWDLVYLVQFDHIKQYSM